MYADEAQRWFRNFSINQQRKWRLVVLPHAGKDIQLVWKGKFPVHIEMTDMDICSLFANLLKIAYEKLQTLSREICVNIKVFNSNHTPSLELAFNIAKAFNISITEVFIPEEEK